MSERREPKPSLQSLAASLNSQDRLELEKYAARLSPAHYAVISSGGKWKPAPHLKLINQLLLWVDSRAINRLVLTLAPRHGKSQFVSENFPTWSIGRNPDDRFILASYEANFAASWGRKVRDKLNDHGERLFGVKLRQDSKAADSWLVEGAVGGMETCGVGGPLTGKGADCLPAGTMITTEQGPVDVADLVWSNSKTKVLAFDHARNQTAWRPIVATRELAADELYEIETVGGRKIRATGDHRICIAGRGYVPAAMVAVDDRLVVQGQVPKQQDVPLAPDDQERDALPGVPRDSPQVASDAVSVARRIRTPGVRVYDIQVEGCHNFFAGRILVHNCLIIDDPFKNAEEANSETIRRKNMDWFRTAAYTRLTPDGAIIMIATRWHEADITGVVLDEMKEGGDQWTYLHLPALHPGKEVWAELTIPGDHAARIKAHEGMTFKQLDAFLDHCNATMT